MRNRTFPLVVLSISSLVIAVAIGVSCSSSKSRAAAGSPSATGSEGQRIYTTGTTASGQRIAASDGPSWFQQKGGGCISCHGATGGGGRVPDSGRYAPSIQYSVLKSENYTDEKIERAITKGENASGEKLNSLMPRWKMTDAQLKAVMGYLKTLGADPPSAAELKKEGEAIYLHGTNAAGKRVKFSDGPSWLKLRGGGCIDCHGKSGGGGKVPSSGRYAPNIQYSVLKSEGYNDDKIKRAVMKGISASGSKLNTLMPRWDLSQEEFEALLAHMKAMK